MAAATAPAAKVSVFQTRTARAPGGRSVLGPDFHVAPRRVLERLQPATAGLPGGNLAARILRNPLLPHRPPRFVVLCRGGEPIVGRERVPVVPPVAVFAA